jgi:Kelch motif
MTDYNIFLTRVAYVMARYFESQVGVCEVHPGMLTDAEQDKLKDNSPLIYTTMSEILQTEKVDTGDVKNDIQMVSFVLVYNLSPFERDKLIRELVFKMIDLLVGQRWNMEYVYPAAEVKAFDLHGLLRKPDEILGTQGWSPTLQARASDLFGDLPIDQDPQFSIWCVTWEQSLVGEPEEKDDIWVIPHTLTSLRSTMKLEPSVKSLSLSDWFSQLDANGTRCLTGDITVEPPDNGAQQIRRYDLYWADNSHKRLENTRKITGILSNNTLKYSFPSQLQVPRHATHIIAYGRSTQGFSPQAAAVAISNIWVDGTALGTAASVHCTITVNGKIFKWGGNNASGTPITTGESYSADTWTALVNIPTALTKVIAMGQVGKKILMLGKTATSFAVAKYNWETPAWEASPNEYSGTNTILSGIMLNYDFYVLTANATGYSEKMILFKTDADSGTDTWLSGDNYGSDTSAPKNPAFNRKQFGICSGNGRLFVLGGKTATAEYLDTFSAYIPGQRKWTTMQSMPHKIRDCNCIVYGSKLYVMGGELETGVVTDKVLCYDFFTATWEELAALTTARKEASVTILNGNIYITGGSDATGSLLSTMEIYIPVFK